MVPPSLIQAGFWFWAESSADEKGMRWGGDVWEGLFPDQREMRGRIAAGGSVAWEWMAMRGRTCDKKDDTGGWG